MTAKLIDPNAAAKITDDLIERLSRAITTHSNDDFSKPKTLERNRFCTRSMAMIDARDHIQEQAARIEALERQVKAADALVEAGNIMARALEGDYIVPGSANKWNAALAAYRATKEGGA